MRQGQKESVEGGRPGIHDCERIKFLLMPRRRNEAPELQPAAWTPTAQRLKPWTAIDLRPRCGKRHQLETFREAIRMTGRQPSTLSSAREISDRKADGQAFK